MTLSDIRTACAETPGQPADVIRDLLALVMSLAAECGYTPQQMDTCAVVARAKEMVK